MHHRALRQLCHAVLLLAASLCCGCGSKFTEVTGKVALTGIPVSQGVITFMPAEGRGPTAAEKIKEGQYSVRILPGRYKVQIRGFRKVGEERANKGDPGSPMKDILEQVVPERFNVASTLTCEIKPGRQQEDFLLDSTQEVKPSNIE